MNETKWKFEYFLGIDMTDKQYPDVFECLLAIESALARNDPGHSLRCQVAKFFNALELHFTVEEALLEVLRYPGWREHLVAHEKLRRAAVELENRLGNSLSSQDLSPFFEHWFANHVLAHEQQFIPHVREQLADHFHDPAGMVIANEARPSTTGELQCLH